MTCIGAADLLETLADELQLETSTNFLKPCPISDGFRYEAIVTEEWICKLSNSTDNYEVPTTEITTESLLSFSNSKLSRLNNRRKIVLTVYPKKCNLKKVELSKSVVNDSVWNYMSSLNRRTIEKRWKTCLDEHGAALTIRNDNGLRDPERDSLHILYEMYNCTIYDLDSSKHSVIREKLPPYETFFHIVPPLFGLVSTNYLYIVQPYLSYTLNDCLTYSPSLMSKTPSKSYFMIYQVLKLLVDMHNNGLALGQTTLDDFFVDDLLFVEHYGPLPIAVETVGKGLFNCNKTEPEYGHYDSSVSLDNLPQTPLPDLVLQWSTGYLSNYQYLMVLNVLAGRRMGDPNNHPILPWVTDFSGENEGYRDLSKSKYRLNKGDPQLDLTFDGGKRFKIGIPHHVSDCLSDITYYTYKARQTPRELLRKHVRPTFVPGEYPKSMARLYAWTPDECIPEFYTTPELLKTIHADLPDLELPDWTKTPEEFIEYHRSLLEGHTTSDELHKWIDLNFGYKLSGRDAVQAKNTYLSLMDETGRLRHSGLVQLFNQPHPKRRRPTPTPVTSLCGPPRRTPSDSNMLSAFQCDSLIDTPQQKSTPEGPADPAVIPAPGFKKRKIFKHWTSVDDRPLSRTNEEPIILPTDFNPASPLEALENLCKFSLSSSGNLPSFNGNGDPEVGGIPLATKTVEGCSRHRKRSEEYRRADITSLACIIAEVFLHDHFKVFPTRSPFNNRFAFAKSILRDYSHEIPIPVRDAVEVLFAEDSEVCDVNLIINPNCQLLSIPQYVDAVYELTRDLRKVDRAVDTRSIISFQERKLLGKTKSCIAAKWMTTHIKDFCKEAFNLVLPCLLELFKQTSSRLYAFLLLFHGLCIRLSKTEVRGLFMQHVTDLFTLQFRSINLKRIYLDSFASQLLLGFGLETFLTHIVHHIIDGVSGKTGYNIPIAASSNTVSLTAPLTGGKDVISKTGTGSHDRHSSCGSSISRPDSAILVNGSLNICTEEQQDVFQSGEFVLEPNSANESASEDNIGESLFSFL